jgi:HNH endonuclease
MGRVNQAKSYILASDERGEFYILTLTKGQVAFVDVESILKDPSILQVSWFAAWCEGTQTYYAQRKENGHYESLHRRVMGLGYRDPRQVDHIDRNTLQNRLFNLRICTQSSNMRNRRIRSCNPTGYRGVRRRGNKFEARISINGKQHRIDSFDDVISAAKAFDTKAREIDPHAAINFPV